MFGDTQVLRSGPPSVLKFSKTRYSLLAESFTILTVPLVVWALLTKLPETRVVVEVGKGSFTNVGVVFFLQDARKNKPLNKTTILFFILNNIIF